MQKGWKVCQKLRKCTKSWKVIRKIWTERNQFYINTNLFFRDKNNTFILEIYFYVLFNHFGCGPRRHFQIHMRPAVSFLFKTRPSHWFVFETPDLERHILFEWSQVTWNKSNQTYFLWIIFPILLLSKDIENSKFVFSFIKYLNSM